jgi:hypothetical protein
VHLPQPQKTSSYLHYFILIASSIFYRVFGRFVTRGVQKHEKQNPQKNPSWLITKNVAFFRRFFFYLGCFARFCLSRFWAFRNKGSAKT